MTKIKNKIFYLILFSCLTIGNINIFTMHRGFSDSSEERERKQDKDRRRKGPRMFWSPSLDTSSDEEEDNTGYNARTIRSLLTPRVVINTSATTKGKVTRYIGKIGEWDFFVTEIVESK